MTPTIEELVDKIMGAGYQASIEGTKKFEKMMLKKYSKIIRDEIERAREEEKEKADETIFDLREQMDMMEYYNK